MKILLDMNFSPRWEEFLVSSGIEATHWSRIGKADAPDPLIMEHAAHHGFAILTADLDFGIRLIMLEMTAPTVIQVRAESLELEIVGTLVLEGIQRMRTDIEHGALITITQRKSRVRLLVNLLDRD